MVSFESDYNNGAHEKVLEAIVRTNGEKSLTYGFDRWSESAKAKIKKECGRDDAEVFFLCGGTQTNAVVIDSLLQKYEGVLCVESSHINVHESGAVEMNSHKVLALKGKDGKMQKEELEQYFEVFYRDVNQEHCVYPGMVYITFPTETGMLYSKEELSGIYSVCQRYKVPLYVDGARLGYGLMAEGNDITMPFLASHCDAFYIGGTKCGALCGEAVVFTHGNTPRHFFTIIKQHGALMAKGRLVGVQFDALFTDGLYYKISSQAIKTAMQVKAILKEKGYRFLCDSSTNQQFVILEKKEAERLAEKVEYALWSEYDSEHLVCRFVTSWATTQQEVDALRKAVMDNE